MTEPLAELDRVFRAGGLGALLGFELVEWEPGRAVVRLRPTPAVANITGSVHGGVLYALADSAFEVACNSYGRVCVALDVGVHHASAAPVREPVTAEAVEVSRSARVASYRITAAGPGGRCGPGIRPRRTGPPAGTSAPTDGRSPGATRTEPRHGGPGRASAVRQEMHRPLPCHLGR